MAKQILYSLVCPKCQGNKLAVATKHVSSNKTPMLFGHCKTPGCGHMMQGKADQKYLNQQAAPVVEPEPVPVVSVAPVVAEVVESASEDFDPLEITHPAPVAGEAEPDEGKKSGKGLLIGLAVAGLFLLGGGAVLKFAGGSANGS